MAHRRKFVCRSLLAALVAVASAGLATAGSVTGQLTDPQGKPVADATVSVLRDRDVAILETHTGSDGRFGFSSLPAGSYQLVAAAADFMEISEPVNVAGSGE